MDSRCTSPTARCLSVAALVPETATGVPLQLCCNLSAPCSHSVGMRKRSAMRPTSTSFPLAALVATPRASCSTPSPPRQTRSAATTLSKNAPLPLLRFATHTNSIYAQYWTSVLLTSRGYCAKLLLAPRRAVKAQQERLPLKTPHQSQDHQESAAPYPGRQGRAAGKLPAQDQRSTSVPQCAQQTHPGSAAHPPATRRGPGQCRCRRDAGTPTPAHAGGNPATSAPNPDSPALTGHWEGQAGAQRLHGRRPC